MREIKLREKVMLVGALYLSLPRLAQQRKKMFTEVVVYTAKPDPNVT